MRRALHHTRGREAGELLTSNACLDRLYRTEPTVAPFNNPKQRTPTRWHECHHIVDEQAPPSHEREQRRGATVVAVGGSCGAFGCAHCNAADPVAGAAERGATADEDVEGLVAGLEGNESGAGPLPHHP
jgi:hypothetical protein